MRVDCRACGDRFDVDEADDTARCGQCGTKYSAPWSDPEIERSPIPEEERTGPRPTATTDDETEGDAPELVEFTIQLPREHVADLQREGRPPEQAIHRAIRLYREMDNADELIAEDDWRRVAAGD